MARIRSIDRDEREVEENSGGVPKIGTKTGGTGWKIEMDEDVDFDAAVTSSGPRPVRVLLCKPGGLFDLWNIFAYVEKTWTWNPSNEDLFVLAQIQNEDGKWVPVDGSQGHSDNQILNEGSEASGVTMSWQTQNILLSIRAH
jgi:hypothetical protein